MDRSSRLPGRLGAALDAYWTGETVNGARVYTESGYRVAFAIAAAAGLLSAACAVVLSLRTRDERSLESDADVERSTG